MPRITFTNECHMGPLYAYDPAIFVHKRYSLFILLIYLHTMWVGTVMMHNLESQLYVLEVSGYSLLARIVFLSHPKNMLGLCLKVQGTTSYITINTLSLCNVE
jgi:hypothetical protein